MAYSSTPKMEAICSSEISLFLDTAMRTEMQQISFCVEPLQSSLDMELKYYLYPEDGSSIFL
jgi:hypothetical protein